MLPTPNTSHVSFDNVYEPSEDSYLLLDALSAPSEIDFLQRHFRGRCPLVLEIGTGSGVVLAFVNANAATIFGSSSIMTVGVDVNGFACSATAMTVNRNAGLGAGTFLGALRGDIATPLRDHSVDVLIFNPPYVPSEDLPRAKTSDQPGQKLESKHARFERDSRLLSLATDGGPEGMDVTNRVLDSMEQVLHRHHGVAYILLCAQNKPNELIRRLAAEWQGWSFTVVHSSGKQGGWEKLVILRIARATSQ